MIRLCPLGTGLPQGLCRPWPGPCSLRALEPFSAPRSAACKPHRAGSDQLYQAAADTALCCRQPHGGLWKGHQWLSPVKSQGGRPGLGVGQRRRSAGTLTRCPPAGRRAEVTHGSCRPHHTPDPVSPRRPRAGWGHDRTYRKICEGYACRRKEQFSGYVFSWACGPQWPCHSSSFELSVLLGTIFPSK